MPQIAGQISIPVDSEACNNRPEICMQSNMNLDFIDWISFFSTPLPLQYEISSRLQLAEVLVKGRLDFHHYQLSKSWLQDS